MLSRRAGLSAIAGLSCSYARRKRRIQFVQWNVTTNTSMNHFITTSSPSKVVVLLSKVGPAIAAIEKSSWEKFKDKCLCDCDCVIYLLSTIIKSIIKQHAQLMSWTARQHCCTYNLLPTNYKKKQIQESHAVAGKPRDAAVNSDRYQQPVGQKQSEWETENIT